VAQKLDEKAAVINGLLSQAGQMKSELEIQGDANALATAQDWFEAEKDKVEIKYGV
jgi:hypothetical protein